MGILLDMYTKSLKFYINDIDMGFALENYDKLGEGELFASLANFNIGDSGTISFVQ